MIQVALQTSLGTKFDGSEFNTWLQSFISSKDIFNDWCRQHPYSLTFNKSQTKFTVYIYYTIIIEHLSKPDFQHSSNIRNCSTVPQKSPVFVTSTVNLSNATHHNCWTTNIRHGIFCLPKFQSSMRLLLVLEMHRRSLFLLHWQTNTTAAFLSSALHSS